MNFNTQDRQKIQDYYTSGQYTIAYRPIINDNDVDKVESKTSWRITTHPDWRWDKYEYRPVKVLKYEPTYKNFGDLMFIYSYGYKIFYNDGNGTPDNPYIITSYLFGTGIDGVFENSITIQGDFQAMGENNTIGFQTSNDTALNIIGKTYSLSENMGPHISFSNADQTENITLRFSDASGVPTLRMTSTKDNDVLLTNKIKTNELTAFNTSCVDISATDITTSNLSVKTLKVDNIADVCYPIGCYYYTSDGNFDPNIGFGGKWVAINKAFLWASDKSSGDATTAVEGEATHVLTKDELPRHTHPITDYGHTHDVVDYGHTHTLHDPGHEHKIRTLGDDYNASNCAGQQNTGNFARDGWNDMTEENWRRGIYATRSYTNISIMKAHSNVQVANGYTNAICDDNPCSGISNYPQGMPHNNMPPYIHVFCWHRIG